MSNTLLNASALSKLLGHDNVVVLDCRFSLADTSQGETAFAESCIPGARYAHLDKHLSGELVPGVTGRHPLPSRDVLEAQFRRWGISNQTQIVAYDDNIGAIASRLWWLSRWLGHEQCAVLDGGFAHWLKNGLPTEQGSPMATDTGNFTAGKPLEYVVLKADVLNTEYLLVDAREAERYRGEHEPIDPVAGRIPGALNNPFQSNIDGETRCFKSAAILLEHFDALLAQANGRKPVHYCGSGVTAAHNMLAMQHAGLDAGALYVGSFSEWVADHQSSDAQPVETG